MSEKPFTPNILTDANAADEVPVVKEPNLFQRKLLNPIKNHPKIAIAVAGGVALIGSAAWVGRATAPDAEIYVVDVNDIEGDQDQAIDDLTVA